MDLEARLNKLRSSLLRGIAVAAQKDDARTVMLDNQRLEQVERLIGQLGGIGHETKALEEGDSGPGAPLARTPVEVDREVPEGNAWRSSGRERGVRRRLEFIRSLPPAARPEEPVTGAVFTAPKLNFRIGVAYAHEGNRVNRWFLGLHDKKFDHAVLLCESQTGKVTHFSLPKEFMAQYRASLSRKGQQLKFNVLKRGGEFFLLVRPGRHINLEKFRDNFYGLR